MTKTWTEEQINKETNERTIRDRKYEWDGWHYFDKVVTDTIHRAPDGTKVERCSGCGLYHKVGTECPICR